MKNINDLGLFDDHFLMEKLTKLGDPLQKLDKFINWKIFESPINEAFKNEDGDLSKGGRPPFNRLVLFKAFIIQSLYNLSDDQLEYQIVDRASFRRFLELKKSDKVPDSKTFWLFREQLIEKDVIIGLFKTFKVVILFNCKLSFMADVGHLRPTAGDIADRLAAILSALLGERINVNPEGTT